MSAKKPLISGKLPAPHIAQVAKELAAGCGAGSGPDPVPLPAEPDGVSGGLVNEPVSAYGGPKPAETPLIGIEKTPGVNGGDACISGTRIPVWVIEEMRRQGWSKTEMLADFPGLDHAQIDRALAYAKKHTAEIDAALRAHSEA